jgi:two-component system sensor histidine kinase TctE
LDLENEILIALSAGEIFLLATATFLVVSGINWGLGPLTALENEIKKRTHQNELDFAPLPLTFVPTELLPFVGAFNALLGQVEASVETLKRFTSDASHQLRAPLAVIRTHVELLNRWIAPTERLRSPLDDIHKAVKALQHLIVQLISMARADQPFEEREDGGLLDLVECTASSARKFAPRAVSSALEISFECDCEELMVIGNAIFVGEILSNVLDNSIRYGRAGGHISIRIKSQSAQLEIEDDGPGIPPEEYDRVFERFYRSPRNLSQEGSGLGLSIVRALSHRMGAEVALGSPDQGTGLKVTIKFELPDANLILSSRRRGEAIARPAS